MRPMPKATLQKCALMTGAVGTGGIMDVGLGRNEGTGHDTGTGTHTGGQS